MDKEALQLLRRIGLNQYESRTYLALLNSRTTTASELSDIAGIPRPRTYDILQKLSKKGFVSTQPGRPVKFRAVNIDEAFESLKNQTLEEKAREIEEIDRINTQLKTRVKKIVPEEKEEKEDMVWVLKNRKNIYSKIEALINNANKSIIIATSEEGLKRKLDEYGDTLKTANERGVEITIMAKKDSKHAEKAKDYAKVIKKDHNHRMIIADDHVMMFLTPEEDPSKEVGAWITSPYFSENLRKIC